MKRFSIFFKSVFVFSNPTGDTVAILTEKQKQIKNKKKKKKKQKKKKKKKKKNNNKQTKKKKNKKKKQKKKKKKQNTLSTSLMPRVLFSYIQ